MATNSNHKQPKELIIPIQLEIIPKSELLSDVETDTSSESEESQSNDSKSKDNNNSFLLVSEYLSKTKAFSRYINGSKDQSNSKDHNLNESVIANDKSIAIDLNRDSDQESTQGIQEVYKKIDSIFNNEIIDLTPKTSHKKSSTKSNAKTIVKSKQCNNICLL